MEIGFCRSPTPQPGGPALCDCLFTATVYVWGLANYYKNPFNRIHISLKYVVKFHFVSRSRLFCPIPTTLRAVVRRDPLKSENQNQYGQKIARQAIGPAGPNR
jgi:hypothetical protein